MSGVFEVIYTSSEILLQEGERDLGVLAATKGTPAQFLNGIPLHRSFPTTELSDDSNAGEVPHKFLLRKIDGFLHLVHVNYAGADHTGRDKPYSHEVIIDQHLTRKSSAPIKLAACFEDRLRWCNRFIEPTWLEPMQLQDVEKTGSEESLKTAVALFGKEHLVAMLDALTLRIPGEFITVLIPVDNWSDSVYRIVDSVLQCLPPHLQHGVMAQPGDVESVPEDVKLVIAPSNSHFSQQIRSSKSAVIDLSSKHGSKNLKEPSSDGYGHQFVAEEKLVLRSMWEYFDLEGPEGVKDSKHILHQEEVKSFDVKRQIEACSKSLVNVSNKKVQKHLGTEFASLLQNTVPLDCLPDCLKAIQLTTNDPEAAVQKLLSHCTQDLLNHKAPLNPVVRDAILKWLFSKADSTHVPKTILKVHFDSVPHPLREKVAREIAPTNSSDWMKITWGYEKTGSDSYVKRAVELIKRQVKPRSTLPNHAVKRLVRKALDTEKHWEDSFRRKVVTSENVFEFDRYLALFDITHRGQKPIWWPREQSRSSSSEATQSSSNGSAWESQSRSGPLHDIAAKLSSILNPNWVRLGLIGILIYALAYLVVGNSSVPNVRFEIVKLQGEPPQTREDLDPISTTEEYDAALKFIRNEATKNKHLFDAVIATGISDFHNQEVPFIDEIKKLITSKSIVGFQITKNGDLRPVDGRDAAWGLRKKRPTNETEQKEPSSKAKELDEKN